MSNFLESVRNRVKALLPDKDVSAALAAGVEEQTKFIWAHREIFIQAWIAETGYHPSQCMLVENRSYDGAFGTISVSIVAKTLEQIEAEREAKKPKPVRVADYFVPRELYNLDCYVKRTHPIGQQPEGSVMVPGSEREVTE